MHKATDELKLCTHECGRFLYLNYRFAPSLRYGLASTGLSQNNLDC
ncbi:MAG: hypothetical protein H8D67_02345 [Deltaproteobacteria bacterium]|nr:hypothetical protein [Deltaproteobacteria bacterium]